MGKKWLAATACVAILALGNPADAGTLLPTTIKCPSRVTGVNIVPTTVFNTPPGWQKVTNYGGYKGVTLPLIGHGISGNQMWCSYGIVPSNMANSYNLAIIQRPFPHGTRCSKISNFSFRCTPSSKHIGPDIPKLR